MKKKSFQFHLPRTGAIYGIIAFAIFFSVMLKGDYINVVNVVNVFRQSSTLCILAICSFLAILTHQTDLSIGAVASLSGMVMALLLQAGVPLVPAVLAAVLSGMAVGALNGVLAGFTTIPTFIITLATMNIARSIGMILNSGTVSVSDPALKLLNATNLWIIPVPALMALLLYGFFFWILRYRKYGTSLYAVGGKEEAALTAGINVKWRKMSVFLINGALAGFAGVVYAARLSAANPAQGNGLELEGICAAVLGGAALTGGQGSVWGAYLGAIAISLLRNGMNRMGVRVIEQMTVIGVMLILILAFDIFTKKRGGKLREH